MPKPGRNDLCLCGSGKKYKKCCANAEYNPPGKEDIARQRLNDEILSLARRDYRSKIDDAIATFWGENDPELLASEAQLGMADINFWEWLVYDWRPDGLKTFPEILQEQAKPRSMEEEIVLERVAVAHLSLYEIQEVFPDKGFLLYDLLLDKSYTVSEKLATRALVKWDVVAERILEIDGNLILSGAIYPYSRNQKDAMVREMKSLYRKQKKKLPTLCLKDFLKQNGNLFCRFWFEATTNETRPTLVNESGETLIISKAVYKIGKDANIPALVNILSCLDDCVMEDEGHFIWQDKSDDPESFRVLATFTLFANKSLEVETNSRERLERARILLETHCGDAISHKADTFEDPYQKMEGLEDTIQDSSDDEEIPFEIQQDIYWQFMDKHYANWFDEPIPALDDKTPKQAMKTKKGRQQVEDLIKLYEGNEEKNKQAGRPAYDFAWMWKKLDEKNRLDPTKI